MRMSASGYVERRGYGGKVWRNWWIIKASSPNLSGYVPLKPLHLPRYLIGKKIRLKVEVLE